MNPNSRLNFSRQRLTTLLAVCIGALASTLAMSSQAFASASDPFAGSGSLAPRIINGRESSIAEFPWQVWVLLVNQEGEATCGGSILNATTILTAAHCTDHEGTTNPYPVPSGEAVMYVVTGAEHGLKFLHEGFHPEPEATIQAVTVKSVRRDPYYAASPETKDDVAVLTLAEPLELSPEKHTQAISLVAPNATPAPGTTLSISGYGKQEGSEEPGHNSNGNLYSTTLTAISSDACRGLVGVNSAVLLCGVSPSSSTCQGDSGGPLTEGSPAVQVGIVDYGLKECPVGKPDVFTNIAAPEIRDFIEGSETPPVATRLTSPPVVKSIPAAPVDFSPLTCEAGGWTTPPTSLSYTFQVENASAQVLQSGSSNVFGPPSALVGSPLVCIVQAASPGGVSTARSATTAPIAADTVVPTASITARKCKLQTCTLSIAASDPNAVALTVQPSAAYAVTAKCPVKKKKKKGKKPAKKAVCHKTKTVSMALKTVSAGVFQAAASKLPYGEKVTFSALASDAAGLKSATAVSSTTLHKPKPKKHKKKKAKKKHKKH